MTQGNLTGLSLSLVPKLQFGNLCALEPPFRRRDGKGVTSITIRNRVSKRNVVPKQSLGTRMEELDFSSSQVVGDLEVALPVTERAERLSFQDNLPAGPNGKVDRPTLALSPPRGDRAG
jgi:hypothetical protein